MNALDQALWDASHQLWVANEVLERCRALFVAIQKLDGDDVVGLARVGQGITEEWSGQLDLYSRPLAALLSPDVTGLVQVESEQGGANGQDAD
ncbi:hypothetical protein D9M69_630610 [compost metagenome]